MTSEPSIKDVVIEMVAKEIKATPEAVRNATTLEELKVDSLEIIEIVMALEDHFKILIPDRELKACKSVDELFGLVERVIREKAEADANPAAGAAPETGGAA
jgi:acyl carrier protein